MQIGIYMFSSIILFHNFKGLNLKPSVISQLFDAFVGATLSYGCEIWGFGKSKES